ncbi:MAG: hypothetical protein JAY74_05740 [Candidatus Thiodiazotropha taylori]|nr:hypothetical protein [Candidatus Thiodiazotropha taylori]
MAISSGVEINRIEGSHQDIKEISSEDEMPAEGLSRVAVVQCFNFSGGSNSYVKLIRTANTSCESFMQCTVRWRQRDGDFIGDVKYRLQSGQSRYIRAYGWSGSIISEGKADLMRGQDVSDRLRLVSNNVSGGVLWSLQNTTSKYAVFKIELYNNGNVHGYATGVIEPSDEVRVFWFGPGENGYCILMLGRSEPD